MNNTVLIDSTVRRPAAFAFMIIDEWSNQTEYDTWDIRHSYMSELSQTRDHSRYIRWLDIKKKIAYPDNHKTLIAAYNLGLPHDLKLFNQTFKYFHFLAKLSADRAAIDYLITLHNQLTDNVERTKTLNKYFINDSNLLITDLDALHLVIKNENITDIVIIGQAWESCIKNRSVGLKYVDLARCNYYIIPELCYNIRGNPIREQEIIECTDTKWARCENFINRTIRVGEIVPMYKLVEILT